MVVSYVSNLRSAGIEHQTPKRESNRIVLRDDRDLFRLSAETVLLLAEVTLNLAVLE